MRKLIIKKTVLFSFIFLFPFCTLASEVDIAADAIEYIENSGKLNAKGHVVISMEERKIHADSIDFDVKTNIMNAFGGVKVEEAKSVVYADSVTYCYDTKVSDLKDAFAYSSNKAFIRLKSMTGINEDTFKIHNIKLSTCDLNEPHFYFKARHGKLILNKRITVYNAVFYIGKVPVFYFPVVTKSLKSGKGFGSNLKIEINPGIEFGAFSLKTAISCSLSENFDGKFVYDYFAERGNGFGTEIKYEATNAIGNLYVYTIKDMIESSRNWTIRPNYFHRIKEVLTIRAKGEFVSNRMFNNFYDQINWERTLNHLESYLSLTRQFSIANLSCDFEYNANYDSLESKYKISSINLPKISLDFYQRNLFWGIIHKPYFEYNYRYAEYSKNNYFYKNKALFMYMLTRCFKIWRMSLTPSLEVTENWNDKDDNGYLNYYFFTQYEPSLKTKYRIASWMDWNIDYNVKARTKKNSIYVFDDLADDYGIEKHGFNLSNNMYIGNRITTRNSISYNLLKNRTSTSATQKWSPLITEFTWFPKYSVTVVVKEGQLIDPFRFNSFQFYVNMGMLEKSYLNFGTFYQRYNDVAMSYRNREIDNILGFGVWLTPKWRLDYNIKTTTDFSDITVKIKEQEIKLYRDLHCYNLGISFRKIENQDYSIHCKFDMKTNMPFSKTKQSLGYEDPEEIFYPWR
jgi:LPS-assembly protein